MFTGISDSLTPTRVLLLALLLLPVPLSTLGCSVDADAEQVAGTMGGDQDEAGADGDGNNEEAVPVEIAALSRGDIEAVLRSSTNLEAESDVQVFSQAARQVTELLVEEGDRVTRGQVLLRLQDDAQRNALAKIESQLDKAEREYLRQKHLFEQELISEQLFNEASYELEQLKIAQADAQRELGYAAVVAPISGTITARLVKLGDQIQLGQHLFDIVDFDSMVARIYVPEKNLLELRPGLPARITAQSLDGRRYDATVKRIAPVVDAQSGTVKVTIGVGRQAGLRPGMYVDVELVTAIHEQALLVPKRALLYDNDQVFLYRMSGDDRVERIDVDPLLADRDNVEPRGGLADSDRIVVAGQAGLKHGALVELIGADSDDAALAQQGAGEDDEEAAL